MLIDLNPPYVDDGCANYIIYGRSWRTITIMR
nr:MAG TPA: hypothetical protein [Caudoviricetes sp.]